MVSSFLKTLYCQNAVKCRSIEKRENQPCLKLQLLVAVPPICIDSRDAACVFYLFPAEYFIKVPSFRQYLLKILSLLLLGEKDELVFLYIYLDVLTSCAAFLSFLPSGLSSAQLFQVFHLGDGSSYLLLFNFFKPFSASGLSTILFPFTHDKVQAVKRHKSPN